MSFNLTIYDVAEKYGLRSMSVTAAATQYNALVFGQATDTFYSWGTGQLQPGQSGTISTNTTGGFTSEYGLRNIDGVNVVLTSQKIYRTDTKEIISFESGSLSTTATNLDASLRNANWFAGNDTILGSSYGNYLSGYSGNDRIDGGGGIDTAVLRGFSSGYTLNIAGNAATSNGADGFDAYVNVERLKFDNLNIALDIGSTQNAGSVYMIYKAAFNRAPDASGMGYWLAQKDNGSNIVTNIAQGFVNSAEFTAKYGTNPSNSSYVDKLYQNVLGRSGDSGGVAYWNQQLDSGSVSKAAALAAFATLPEGASNVASLIANGIPYTEFVG